MNQSLPEGILTLSLELYVAYSEKWLYRQIEPETEERDYTLYLEHSQLDPSRPLVILDPTSGYRIEQPVRGLWCQHLEVRHFFLSIFLLFELIFFPFLQTFDLHTYVQTNRISSEWRCPHCYTFAPPHTLRTCSWTTGVLASDL